MSISILWLCIAVGWMPDGMICRLLSVHLRHPSDPAINLHIGRLSLLLWKRSLPHGPWVRWEKERKQP